MSCSLHVYFLNVKHDLPLHCIDIYGQFILAFTDCDEHYIYSFELIFLFDLRGNLICKFTYLL